MAHILDFKTVLAKKDPISHYASFRRIFVSIFRLTRKDGVIQRNQVSSIAPITQQTRGAQETAKGTPNMDQYVRSCRLPLFPQ
jgi:hypothetical protein